MSSQAIAERGAPLDRRGFLMAAGFVGLGGSVAARSSPESHANEPDPTDPFAVLVDTTLCVGCRTCEKSCAKAHGLPEPPKGYQKVTSPAQRCVVQAYQSDDPKVEAGAVFVKRQCMNCLQPACASACLTKAMLHTDDGPVVWRAGKCMGCRYCMVSCPFDMPKFEYDSPVPVLQKCDLCAERVAEGLEPVCVENCPAEALTFGRRSEILAEAHKRIAESPDAYEGHIFGEREAGGTSWLYLAATPFERIGFESEMSRVSYPTLTKEFLYAVPVVLTLVPPLLASIASSTAHAHPALPEGGGHDVA